MPLLLCLAGIALSILALFGLGIPAYVLCAVGFILCVIGGLMRARLSLALAGMVFAAFVFAITPDGFSAILEMMDVNPRGFFRVYDGASGFIGALLILALTLLMVRRHAPASFETMLGASDDIDRIVVGVGKIAAWLFIPMMIVIFYDVSQRKMLDFDNNIIDSAFYFDSTKLQELQWHLHSVLFLLCLGFAYRYDAHVRIELVRDRMKPRTRVWMEFAGIVAFLLTYCYLIVEFGWVFASKSYEIGEVSAAQTGLSHRWVVKSMLPIGFAFLFAAGLSAAFRCAVFLFGPAHLQAESGDYAGTHHADLPEDVASKGPITD
ncbi:TRAP transporter small permease subunit [Stappia sp.]|uniref:TRAP transporter small permease subunit n=1 Tax=Stappia sp. TaxID=1870903 RepID=UPI0032D99CFB